MKTVYAELHTPLFFNGINFGSKLDVSRKSGLSLDYDRQEKELIVTFKGHSCIVPVGNVAIIVPEAPEQTIQPEVQKKTKQPFSVTPKGKADMEG